MKKILFFGLMLAFAGMIVGCSSCNKEESADVEASDTDSAFVDLTTAVDNIIGMNRERMYILAKGGDYRYFETDVKLVDFLDSEQQDGDVAEVVSVFQVVINDSVGYDTQVWMIGVGENGPKEVLYDGAFYLENLPLNDGPTEFSFEQALDRLMRANVVKPHSRYVVLRKPLGPKPCNAQWIFGNKNQSVFVDAVTGDVRTTNPAFDNYVGGPLGEWP